VVNDSIGVGFAAIVVFRSKMRRKMTSEAHSKPKHPQKPAQWPLVVTLLISIVGGFVLTRMRDGWPEDIAWLAISIAAGALVMLFRERRAGGGG